MSMVEKVARAMWARRREVLAEAGWPRMSLWEHESDTLREDVRAEARAAIEGMRDVELTNTKQSFEACWRAMIDTALSNTREKDNG